MISKRLKDEIWDYCRLNDITDIDGFIERMTQQGFNVEKYGNTPMTPEVKEVEVIKEIEVIKEVEKEVPVEVIKEVEVVKEVPVEVIKEVVVEKEVPVEIIQEVEKVVEKEVYVTDDETINELQEKLDFEIRTSKAQSQINEELVQEKESLYNELQETKTLLKDTIEDIDEERKVSKVIYEKNTELTRRIEELELSLEEEKSKPKREKKEITLPDDTKTSRSSINWVSREERKRNLYDD